MHNPKLSIIIPAYNIENHIRNCINSLAIDRHYETTEVIIVNDGSSDSTLSICLEIEKSIPSVKVISKPNGGLSSARNTGIEAAKGDYIWFVDGDDTVSQEAISIIIPRLSTNSEIYMINHYNCIEGNKYEYNLRFESQQIMKGANVLALNGAMQAWISIVNRSFLTNNKLFFKDKILHEDFEWCIRTYSLAAKVEHIDSFLYNYWADRCGSIMNKITSQSPIGYASSAVSIRDFIRHYNLSKPEEKIIQKTVAIGITFSIIRTLHLNKHDFQLVVEYYKNNLKDIIYFLERSTPAHYLLSFMMKVSIPFTLKLYARLKS